MIKVGHTSFKAGFSLIELVLVIGITGVLATAGIAAYTTAQKYVRDAKRKSDMETISQSLELYRSAFGTYPPENVCDSSVGSFGGSCTCYKSANTCTPLSSDWNSTSALVSALKPRFSTSLPKDPINDATYYYYYEPVCNESATICGKLVNCTSLGCCAHEIGTLLESSNNWHTVCSP